MEQSQRRRLDPNDYTVLWIAPLMVEAKACLGVLDEIHQGYFEIHGGQDYIFSGGKLNGHNIILATFPKGQNYGTVSAAALLNQARMVFPTKLTLLVGIAAGVPRLNPADPKDRRDIRLGDILVAVPGKTSTGIVQYDLGTETERGFTISSRQAETLSIFRSAYHNIELHYLNPYVEGGAFTAYLHAMQSKLKEKYPEDNFECPDWQEDVLYSYVDDNDTEGEIVDRGARDEPERSRIFYGNIGSGNKLMRNHKERDQLRDIHDLIGLEMEAAGIMNYSQAAVIRGVCDYGDRKKNKDWQGYAAAVAAVYAKAVLMDINPIKPKQAEGVLHVPFHQISGFVGRTNELRDLKQKLLKTDGCRVVSVLGLGGVGKSRLALELIHQIKSEHPHYSILWVQAADQLTFGLDMLEIGKKLGIPGIEDEKADVKTLVKERLSSKGEWCLILDNADDESLWGKHSDEDNGILALVECLPITRNGCILVTTRTRRVTTFLSGKDVVELPALPSEEAAEMFSTNLEAPELASDRAALFSLLDKLTYLPLAIVQAASYMNMTQRPVRVYLEPLNQSEADVIKLLSKDFGDTSRLPRAKNPVATTWLISFDHIQKHHPLATRFLSSMACFREKAIPKSLLAMPGAYSEADIYDAVAVLTGYSFVGIQTGSSATTGSEESYDMHRLVQLAARNWLTINGLLAENMKDGIRRMVKLFPTPDYKHKSIWMIYLPHAQRLCEERGNEELPERYVLLENMGLCFVVDGKYREAVEMHNEVVLWRESYLGTSDKQTLEGYNNLGKALEWQGEYPKAKIYLEKAFYERYDKLGPKDPATLTSMANLASVLQRLGNYIEAEKIHREALQLKEIALGQSHPDTLISMNDLALVLESQRNYIEAEKLHQETLQLKEIVLGKSHPETLTSMDNLAGTLYGLGNYIEAEKMYREALQLRETVLGKSHPQTLTSMHNVAGTLYGLGNYIEAEKMYREVLHLSETVLGKSHPETLTSMHNVAETLNKLGNYIKAEKMHREVLHLSETVLGKSHPETLTSMDNLAETLNKLGNYIEAEEMHREALRLRESIR